LAKISLIKLWTKEEHQKILGTFLNNTDAAIAYNNKFRKGDVLVSRQLVRYWRSIFMDNGGSKAKANNALMQARKLIQPSPTDDIGDTFVPETCRRVLVIGDLHEPYTHPDAYDFLRTVRDEYCPDIVVQIGDETDGHAISFHDSDANLDSAGVELEKAKLGLEKLHNLFPNLLLCDSNHGSLIYQGVQGCQYIHSHIITSSFSLNDIYVQMQGLAYGGHRGRQKHQDYGEHRRSPEREQHPQPGPSDNASQFQGYKDKAQYRTNSHFHYYLCVI
jgi:hypothetical protein